MKNFYSIVVFSLLLFFGYFVLSDEVNTRYTNFYFLSGGFYSTQVSMNMTGAQSGDLTIFLENKSNDILEGKFSVVDADLLTYGSKSIRVCKSENEKNIFGQYATIDTDSFSIVYNGDLQKNISLTFPSRYSGLYYGCVVYYPNYSESNSSLNTSARKAIFIDVDVVPIAKEFNIKVYPSDRSNSAKKGNYGVLRFYDINNTGEVLSLINVETDANGEGKILDLIEYGEYYVVYKGQSHLASYISGFVYTGLEDTIFDFTIGSNVFYTKDYSTLINDGNHYQIVGDLKNSIGIYDGKVNVNDITMLVSSACNYNGTSVDQYHPCNLNGDGMVNMADIGVIITNISKEGPYLQGYEIFGGF